MKFPHYFQLDAMDCGAVCLKILAQYYGRSYSINDIRKRCHISREGVSLLGISTTAESIGFRTTGAMLTWNQLCSQVDLPCIVHWNQQHFVIVYQIKKERGIWWVYISDPAAGLLKYSAEQFKKSGFAALI